MFLEGGSVATFSGFVTQNPFVRGKMYDLSGVEVWKNNFENIVTNNIPKSNFIGVVINNNVSYK